MNKKAVAISEAAGCFTIYAAAVYLHFAYPLCGGAALGILFGAVNESVWEHAKIFSAAYIGWSLLQLSWLKVRFRQYAAAKCIGLYTLMGLIIGCHYGYVVLSGEHLLCADIGLSVAAVVLVQVLTYFFETGENQLADYFAPAMMLLMLYYLMFFSFTIFPPKTELFRDPTSGGFGIIEKIVEREG